jgi:hypothetical protein
MGRQIALVALIVVGGCATIVKGTDQQVSIDTPGYSGAECTLTSKEVGSRRVITPAVVTLPKSRENVSVRCTKGCARGSGVIGSSTEGMTAGNVLVGGVIGLGVDAASGAMNHYNDNNQIAMTADPTCTG